MDSPAYLQQLKLEKLAQQVIPITAQLDKRMTHALAEVSAPQKSRRIWTGFDSSSSSSESETEAKKRAAAMSEPSSKKRPEILPPPSILSTSMDLGRAVRRTAELDAFEAQMPLEVREEFEKRVQKRIADERRRTERRCRRKLRAFNKRGVFDKDVNSVRIKTALHVEYAKRADEKILRAAVLMEMLEEYKWKRSHGQEVHAVEHKLGDILEGTALQAVTSQGKKALLEREDLVPQVMSGIARRIRRLSQELQVRDAAATEAALKDPTLGVAKSAPLKLAPLRAPPSRDKSSSKPPSRSGLSVTTRSSRGREATPPAIPAPHSPMATHHLPEVLAIHAGKHDGDTDDNLSDLASPKGVTREDMRISTLGKHIGGPTINPATRSQPVFIQHLQGVTAGVQEETRHWVQQSGIQPEVPAVSAALPRPTVAAIAVDRPRSPSGDLFGDVSSTVMLRPYDSLAAKIPDENEEFSELLLGDRSGVHMSKSGGSQQDRASRRDLLNFQEYRSQVLRKPTIRDEVQAQMQRLRDTMSSVTLDGDVRLEHHVNASQGIAGGEFSQSLRTRALGRHAAPVGMLQHKPRDRIALDASATTGKRMSVSASQPALATSALSSTPSKPELPESPLFRGPLVSAASPQSPTPVVSVGSDPKPEPDRLQTLMNTVWDRAEMPTGQRLDFLLKYSQPDFAARLSDALELWTRALDGISLLEHIKISLKKIKLVAQDPMRGAARPGESPSRAVYNDVPRFTPKQTQYLKSVECFVARDPAVDGIPLDQKDFDNLLGATRTQFEAVFHLLKEHVLQVADIMYAKFEEVLTYRGTDYGAVLASGNAITAVVEYAEPVLRQVSHLLK